MGKPTGEHSSKPKGDNGKVDLKASGMTTESTEGEYKSSGAAPDSSKKHRITSA